MSIRTWTQTWTWTWTWTRAHWRSGQQSPTTHQDVHSSPGCPSSPGPDQGSGIRPRTRTCIHPKSGVPPPSGVRVRYPSSDYQGHTTHPHTATADHGHNRIHLINRMTSLLRFSQPCTVFTDTLLHLTEISPSEILLPYHIHHSHLISPLFLRPDLRNRPVFGFRRSPHTRKTVLLHR